MAAKTSNRKAATSAGPATTEATPAGPQRAPPADIAGEAPRRDSSLAQQATLFIKQAASVLEREIAAGIAAAQSLEQKLVDVNRLRSQSPDELMQKVRGHLHELTDILVDLIAIGVQTVDGVAKRAIRVSQGVTTGSGAAGQPSVPTLAPEAAARPGTTAIAEMALENASDATREVAGFVISDLVAPNGERIEARHVSFEPIPVSIAPHGKVRITVRVAVPDGVGAAVYSGLILATRMEQVRALLSVTVEEGAG